MSKKKATAISLPLSRTQKIMVSAVGVQSVTQDIVALTTKATEIFLMDFARRAYDQSSDEEFRSNVLEYDDIQKLVHSDPRYDFLIDTTPKRIKFSEALKLVEEAKRHQEALENTDSNHTKAQQPAKPIETHTETKETTESQSDDNLDSHDNRGEEEEEDDDDDEDQEHSALPADEEEEDDDDESEVRDE